MRPRRFTLVPDWLNDGVKGFLSDGDGNRDARALFASYPDDIEPGLRVFVAAPEYLFAMKCLAMRGGVEASLDRKDIELPAEALGIRHAGDALALVSKYYPDSRISPKTMFGIEEMFRPTDEH